MKAMFLGFAAAILIAAGAAAVLTGTDHSSAQRTATPSARL